MIIKNKYCLYRIIRSDDADSKWCYPEAAGQIPQYLYIMSLYKDKYRVESIRLKNWDYTFNGYYFITICTKNKECYFGEIIDDKMILSEIGKIAHKYWQEIPKHFPFAQLDKFVIMPNHMHGIIIIDNGNVETPKLGVSTTM